MPNRTGKDNDTPSGRRPWTSGPAEILQHGLDLLEQDTDTSRRLAMLSIDNAVELDNSLVVVSRARLRTL